jgi:peptidoglycan hydrolase-like protein with peptidoglycan-binding domain
LLVYHGIFDIDGSFGSITEAGVKSFQSKNGLPVTGKVDQNTWDKLLGVE